MIRRFSKIVIITFIVMIIFGGSMVYASNSPIEEMDEEVKGFNDYSNKTKIDIGEVVKQLVGIGQILTFVGTGVYVAAIAYMGIKYMTTTSPEKRASLKMQLIGLLVSGIVIFGAYEIWCITIDIFNN